MANYALLKTAFETHPFSLASVGDIVAVMKPDLMDIGFEYFGSIALIGKPKTGKTSIMKACKYTDQGGNLNVWERPKDFDERLKKFEANSYVLTDDVMKAKTGAVKNRGATNVDTSTHRAFQGDGPILAFTIEREVMDSFGDSTVTRLLYLYSDDYWNQKTKDLLTLLQNQKKSNSDYLPEFKSWYANVSYDFAYKLKKARERRKDKDERVTDMVFVYQTALEVVSDFFKDKIGEGIPPETIQVLVDEVIQTVDTISLTRDELTELMLRRFIRTQKNGETQRPATRTMCRRYLDGACWQSVENPCTDYKHCFDEVEGYYSPEDLTLKESNGYRTVFIEDPTAIWSCPHDLQSKPRPILVVPTQYLLNCMNHELEDYCHERKTRLERFTEIESRKLLCQINRLMYTPEAKGNRYTFPYRYEGKDQNIGSLRVVFIILRDEEAEMLRLENDRMPYINDIWPDDDQRYFVRLWKEDLYQIISMAGPVGVESVSDKNTDR